MREALPRLQRRLDSPYVFKDNNGKKYGDVKRSFKTALRRAGIKDFRFHDLRRHTSSQVTWLWAGVDLAAVSKLLGHKSITMTLRYAHLAPSHIRNAVDILDSTIGAREKTTIQQLYN